MANIRVRATQVGYFGHLREIGDEFEIENIGQFAENWMEKIVPVPSGKKAKSTNDEKE